MKFPEINWKIRFQNPMFYFQIVLSFLIPVLAYMGLNWSDMTTWGAFFDLLKGAFSNPYCLSIAFLSTYNTIVDSSSPGISDSEHVLCMKCLFSNCDDHEKNEEPEE